MRTWIIPAIYIFLGALSCITLSSVAPALAIKQLTAFILGGIVIALFSQIPFSLLLKARWLLYTVNVFLLLLPLFVFDSTRGTHRWIELGPLTYQPSQTAGLLALFTVIITLTSAREVTFQVLFKTFFLAILPIGLVFIAPDLGSAMLVTAALLSPLLFVRIKLTRMVPIVLGCSVIALISWLFLLQPYQKERLQIFITGEKTENYNTHQALIAVGSGTLFGRGIGRGVQSHLRFLPERQTDFIFASFAEEFGFLGTSVLIATYFSLLLFLWYMSHSVKTTAGQLFMLSTTMLFLLQISINIHMNLGLLPITGVTLPFMSYGGSSVLALAVLLGICEQLIITAERKHSAYLT